MKHLNRSLMAALLAGGLCGGIGLARAGSIFSAPPAQRLDEEHWKHPHMHHALDALKEARKDMDDAEVQRCSCGAGL